MGGWAAVARLCGRGGQAAPGAQAGSTLHHRARRCSSIHGGSMSASMQRWNPAVAPRCARLAARRAARLLRRLVVVSGHKGHLGDGGVVDLAADVDLERGAGLGHTLVDVTTAGTHERLVCACAQPCALLQVFAVKHHPLPTAPYSSNSTAAGDREAHKGGAHPMLMFFFRQGLKAPLVMVPTFFSPSALRIWGAGEPNERYKTRGGGERSAGKPCGREVGILLCCRTGLCSSQSGAGGSLPAAASGAHSHCATRTAHRRALPPRHARAPASI